MNTPTRADQAADWFLRLQEDVTEEELREWTQWCSADMQNLREYERIGATWAGLGRVRPPVAAPSRHFMSRPVAMAAAAACVAVGIGGWFAWQSGLFVPDRQVLSASHIANQSATLPDGSTLTLAPRTNVVMDFSGGTRSLDLSAGEAYFKVSPNKLKPFVVDAAGLKVTALGTAFNIKSEPNRVVVTVEEGLVEAANGAGSWRVGAGYQLAYDMDRRSARLASVDPRRELGWREGRLEYFNAPLATVVADVSLYANRQIEIADPHLGQLTYTGTISTQSLEDWLKAVQTTFPVRVELREDRVLLRSSR